MKVQRFTAKSGFTLVEIMIVVAIIGLLAALAIPGFTKARAQSHGATCRQNRRIIFEALNIYCMEHGVELTPANFPNLCASRDTLAPGGSSEYVKDWKIFECPVADGQDEHDYAYVWVDDVLVDIRCNNTDSLIRDRHNQH
jgi:prepilin-type N-terminal cleavage/methylation domain-containing protein